MQQIANQKKKILRNDSCEYRVKLVAALVCAVWFRGIKTSENNHPLSKIGNKSNISLLRWNDAKEF